MPRIKISCGDAITLLNNDIDGSKDTPSPSSSLSSTPIFETLDEMLVRVNELLANKPINGMLLFIYCKVNISLCEEHTYTFNSNLINLVIQVLDYFL